MPALSGFILIDKPAGPTSHDIVDGVRRVLRERRVGHCGTLDPAATGLLVVGVGDALKWQDQMTNAPKTYRGVIRLGMSTETDDVSGKVLTERPAGHLTREQVEAVIKNFTGILEQRVPRFSAVKVDGRRLYERARAGETFDLPTRTIEIFRFEVNHFSQEKAEISFEVECSKGTYIRALARDVGEALGVGGCLSSLRRERIGGLSVENAISWPQSSTRHVLEGSLLPDSALFHQVKVYMEAGIPLVGGEGVRSSSVLFTASNCEKK